MSGGNTKSLPGPKLAGEAGSADELLGRIRHYLWSGGLYNPELADHLAVRDLILDCRDWIERAWQSPNSGLSAASRKIE